MSELSEQKRSDGGPALTDARSMRAARAYRKSRNAPGAKPKKATKKRKGARSSSSSSSSAAASLKTRDTAMLRKLTEKLAKQLLRRDADAAVAERKVAALKEQLEDLNAWQGAARSFVQRTADKRKNINEQFAARDKALVLREQKVGKADPRERPAWGLGCYVGKRNTGIMTL